MKEGKSSGRPLTPWQRSAEFRAIAVRTLRAFNAARNTLPRCSAKAKSTGDRCRQPAMASGVCRYHGGATPKGKGWHKPVWPADGPAFEKKLHRKLKTQERTRKRKSAKLNAMTDEERRQHDNWRRAHKIGSAAARRQAKEDRAQAASFRAMLAADEPKAQSLEALAVQAELEQARAKLDELMGVGIFG